LSIGCVACVDLHAGGLEHPTASLQVSGVMSL
jgi:hypothetical protein